MLFRSDASLDYADGSWRHVAAVVADTAQVYVNGKKIAEVPRNRAYNPSPTSTILMGADLASAYNFDGVIDEAAVYRQQQLLERLALPTAMPAFKHQELIAAMRHDKKVEFGKLRFVLPSRIGHVELVDGVEVHQIEQALTGTGA